MGQGDGKQVGDDDEGPPVDSKQRQTDTTYIILTCTLFKAEWDMDRIRALVNRDRNRIQILYNNDK